MGRRRWVCQEINKKINISEGEISVLKKKNNEERRGEFCKNFENKRTEVEDGKTKDKSDSKPKETRNYINLKESNGVV